MAIYCRVNETQQFIQPPTDGRKLKKLGVMLKTVQPLQYQQTKSKNSNKKTYKYYYHTQN
jgi:hypothetical protein